VPTSSWFPHDYSPRDLSVLRRHPPAELRSSPTRTFCAIEVRLWTEVGPRPPVRYKPCRLVSSERPRGPEDAATLDLHLKKWRALLRFAAGPSDRKSRLVLPEFPRLANWQARGLRRDRRPFTKADCSRPGKSGSAVPNLGRSMPLVIA